MAAIIKLISRRSLISIPSKSVTKTLVFLTFSGSMEKEYWRETGYICCHCISQNRPTIDSLLNEANIFETLSWSMLRRFGVTLSLEYMMHFFNISCGISSTFGSGIKGYNTKHIRQYLSLRKKEQIFLQTFTCLKSTTETLKKGAK